MPEADWLSPPDPPVNPAGFKTSTDVTNTMIANGMRMTPMVRNCRLR
jgi:hypothetical protein